MCDYRCWRTFKWCGYAGWWRNEAYDGCSEKKTRIRPLTEKNVHYCEAEHGTIFGEYGVEERLDGSLMNSWESSDQKKGCVNNRFNGRWKYQYFWN